MQLSLVGWGSPSRSSLWALHAALFYSKEDRIKVHCVAPYFAHTGGHSAPWSLRQVICWLCVTELSRLEKKEYRPSMSFSWRKRDMTVAPLSLSCRKELKCHLFSSSTWPVVGCKSLCTLSSVFLTLASSSQTVALILWNGRNCVLPTAHHTFKELKLVFLFFTAANSA